MYIATSHNRSRRPQLDTFFSNGVGSIEIAKCAIFSTNCAILCETHLHFFLRGHRAKDKQTKCVVGHYRRRRWIHTISLPPLNLRQDLDENLSENKCEDCECYVKHRIESDFEKSSDEEMLEMSCDEYTLRTKQANKRKTCEEEVAEKLTTRTLIIIINFPQIYLWIHYKYSSTSFKQRLLQEFHLNSTLNIITFPPLSANVIGLGSVVQWSRSSPSLGSSRFILGDPGAVSRDDRMLVVKVHCQIETSPWALTLTQPVPEAFELPASELARKIFFLTNQKLE